MGERKERENIRGRTRQEWEQRWTDEKNGGGGKKIKGEETKSLKEKKENSRDVISRWWKSGRVKREKKQKRSQQVRVEWRTDKNNEEETRTNERRQDYRREENLKKYESREKMSKN